MSQYKGCSVSSGNPCWQTVTPGSSWGRICPISISWMVTLYINQQIAGVVKLFVLIARWSLCHLMK